MSKMLANKRKSRIVDTLARTTIVTALVVFALIYFETLGEETATYLMYGVGYFIGMLMGTAFASILISKLRRNKKGSRNEE